MTGLSAFSKMICRRAPRRCAGQRSVAIPRTAWHVAGLLLLGLALDGCAANRMADGVYRAPEDRYRLSPPGPPWVMESSRPDRLTFRAPALDAAMAVFEDCRSPEPGELRWVAHHLFFGLRDREVQDREPLQLGAAGGVRTRLRATLEGQPVELEAVTVRARCLYDLVYAAPPDRFEGGRGAFQALVQSFAAAPPGAP